jgi:hypothetical protein
MAAWRRKALAEFADRRAIVLEAESPYLLFTALGGELRAAYRGEPRDHSFIERVYDFAEWCFAPTQHPNLRNAAAVAFYEHIADFDPARPDLARRFTPRMWHELQPLLSRMLSELSYAAFVSELPNHVRRAGD